MKNLKLLLTKLLKQPLQIIPKGFITAIFLLSLVGFAIATYLTIEHFQNKIPPCSIGGCEVVLTSAFATVAGIPISLFGSIFYFVILVSLLLFWDTKREIFARIPIILSILGAIVSVILILVMVFVLKSICIYCMFSDVITIIIAILSIIVLRKNKHETLIGQ